MKLGVGNRARYLGPNKLCHFDVLVRVGVLAQRPEVQHRYHAIVVNQWHAQERPDTAFVFGAKSWETSKHRLFRAGVKHRCMTVPDYLLSERSGDPGCLAHGATSRWRADHVGCHELADVLAD